MLVNLFDYCKITPTGLVITQEKYRSGSTSSYNSNNYFDISQEKGIVKGNLSNHSIKRIKNAFYLLISITPFQTFIHPKTLREIKYKLTFITLTLSAIQGTNPDKKIKRELLNHWLITAKRQFNVSHYLWKAETQKNGNIHFHITTNRYIDSQKLRDSWNNIQNKLGYVDLFNEKHNHINPNSTDIHSVKNIHKMGAYVAKYISKNEKDRRLVEGKIFDCSNNLKSKNRCEIEIHNEDIAILYKLSDILHERMIYSDYFKFIPMDDYEKKKYLPDRWMNEYNGYLDRVRNG